MDLYIAFGIFIASMLVCIVTDHTMVIALLIGLVCFLYIGSKRGFKLKEMSKMCISGAKDSLIVSEVMIAIGMITAIWRLSGTITIFVYYGIKVIVPPLFLLIAFLLCAFLSYSIGTSFGVVGTVGVIFMALARSGGVDPIITGGVIMSGIYFGDRCSPVSSSANMVAGVTGTEIFNNVKAMMKTAVLPLVLVLVAYSVLSFFNPISHVDEAMIATFEEEFKLSVWAVVPAIIVILLPLLKVRVLKAIGASVLAGILVAYFVQGAEVLEILKVLVFGYEATGEGLGQILNGGGIISMVEIIIILTISSCYSGLFNGTKMLEALTEKLVQASTKLGRFAVMVVMSIAMSVIFCNQTIGTLMCANLMSEPYERLGGTKEELAIDMENSVILIACMVPWSIGCSVPLAIMGVTPVSVLFAWYMWLVPLTYLFTKKKWYNN